MRKPRVTREPYSRLLWWYEAVARKVYECWNCPDSIYPGERYIREVWARGSHAWVWRFHQHCERPYFDDDEEMRNHMREEAEEALERAA